jgi:uracil-DNA glycosylase family 4
MGRWEQLNEQIRRCELCPRLRRHCAAVAERQRPAFQGSTYWSQPVPNFGDSRARLLIVGLAPAAHGGNRTGRMFTGDRSGDWLFRALHRAGFSNRPTGQDRNDGLRLTDCSITASCHCAPPDNKPTPKELRNCRPWLNQTIDLLPVCVFLALGQIAWRTTLGELRRREWLVGATPKFGHGAQVAIADGRWLVGSYHPSQRNTFTGLLTEPMFDAVFRSVRTLLDAHAGDRRTLRQLSPRSVRRTFP